MDDRDAREAGTASAEARRGVPGLAPKPAEEFRQDLMVRYLQAMASQSAEAAAREPAATAAARADVQPAAHAIPVPELQVRHVMRRTVAGITADTPFLEVARLLAREQVGAAPVVDADQRVIGVIAESDLLARAASLASDERPGTFERLFGRRQAPEGDGGTAATLMTAPALTVHPWTHVLEAARQAARSRIRQIYVTDHKGTLVGVVSRSELLHALVREDAAIREEVVSKVMKEELGIDPAQVDVQVRNGTVTLSGSLDAEAVPRLTEAVAGIPDVVEVVDHLIAV
ncbi:CBS domain-containing protein [Streptomyces sp. NPDC020996]|uniref:CBS domain-containing protein n=1 Tax=Streptomyces sp. NPDC020996 TaxID=3154791 RepID=UPI0033D82DDC